MGQQPVKRRALSIYLAALVLWAIANALPFMTLKLEGRALGDLPSEIAAALAPLPRGDRR